MWSEAIEFIFFQFVFANMYNGPEFSQHQVCPLSSGASNVKLHLMACHSTWNPQGSSQIRTLALIPQGKRADINYRNTPEPNYPLDRRHCSYAEAGVVWDVSSNAAYII
jgi:hypothetical protein